MSIFQVDASFGDILSRLSPRERRSLLTALSTKEDKPMKRAFESIRKVQAANPEKIKLVSPFFSPDLLDDITEETFMDLKEGFSEVDNSLELVLGARQMNRVYNQIQLGRKFTSPQLKLLIAFFNNDVTLLDWLQLYQSIHGKQALRNLVPWDFIVSHVEYESLVMDYKNLFGY